MASGCPLNNLCPEWNDLVYTGNWEQAYERLEKTNCFSEFTARVCPALCEEACTCGLNGDPVASKANELAIIEYAWEKGGCCGKWSFRNGCSDAAEQKRSQGNRI